DLDFRNAQPRRKGLEPIFGRPRCHECAEKHVPTDPGGRSRIAKRLFCIDLEYHLGLVERQTPTPACGMPQAMEGLYTDYRAESFRERRAMAMPADGRKRVVIEGVTPEIDGGRFPIKRVTGESVVVEADVFADGHDLLECRLCFR